MTLRNLNMVTIRNLYVLCLMLFSVNPVFAEDTPDPEISKPVTQLHETLLQIMQTADKLTFDERYQLTESSISETFNIPLISRIVLGRHWKSLDETMQQDFINLFMRLTVATYVNRFDSYKNQVFNEVSKEQLKETRYLIKTELKSEEKTVSLDYIVQKSNEDWRIVSVIANGVNDLSLKRAEYASYIKDQGYDALIGSIEQKISDLHLKK